ncbi:MAG TPA: VWA domain-containing protein [Terriglobia bacterium]|nr:VWA domain-containing protein [Terriglobia bacterium]
MAWLAVFAALTLAATLAAPTPASAQEPASAPPSTPDPVADERPVFSKPRQPAQPPDIEKQQQEATKFRVQSTLVTTPLTVFDSSGQLVYDLEEKDVRLLDNGVPQRIERFEAATDPVAAVIVVQTNDAVGPLLPQVRPLGSLFSGLLLGSEGQAAVIFYGDRVRVAQDFSSNSDRLAATLKSASAWGSAARLNDALARAVALLEKRPRNERRVIIAFSDGFDSGSETDRQEVVRRATSAEVTVYGLRFNPAEALLMQKPQDRAQSPLDANVARPLPGGLPPTPTNSAAVYDTPTLPVVPIIVATGEIIRSALASSLLEFYAGYTGGVYLSHWTKTALQGQLSRIASEIQGQYELAYVPDTLSQSGFHRIEVQVRRPGMKVRARAGYFTAQQEQGP